MNTINTWLIYRSRLLNAGKLDALVISKKGKRFAVRTARENFKKIVDEAGPLSIKKVTPHSLRHAFATHAIEGEQDIFVLKSIMGHASTKGSITHFLRIVHNNVKCGFITTAFFSRLFINIFLHNSVKGSVVLCATKFQNIVSVRRIPPGT